MSMPSGLVKFEWIPQGQSMPVSPDPSTVYFDSPNLTIYVGDFPFKGATPLTPEQITEIVNNIQ